VGAVSVHKDYFGLARTPEPSREVGGRDNPTDAAADYHYAMHLEAPFGGG